MFFVFFEKNTSFKPLFEKQVFGARDMACGHVQSLDTLVMTGELF